MIEGVDYFVRIVRFPNRSTPGQIWLNADGTYDIYIDERLSDAEKINTLAHELRHLAGGHFTSLLDIKTVEREADDKFVNIFALPDMIPEFKSLEHFRHYIQQIEKQTIQP